MRAITGATIAPAANSAGQPRVGMSARERSAAATPPIDQPVIIHPTRTLTLRPGASSFTSVTLTGRIMPKPSPVATRRSRKRPNESPQSAVARFAAAANHSAPMSVGLRPTQSASAPVASAPSMNPTSPEETRSPAALGFRCQEAT